MIRIVRTWRFEKYISPTMRRFLQPGRGAPAKPEPLATWGWRQTCKGMP